MSFKEDVGNRLKLIRKDRGYTQNSIVDELRKRNEECADIFPVDDKGWQSWEKGRTMPKDLLALVKICDLFGVSSDYVLGLSDEMKPGSKEFQQKTGLSESALTNISKYKDNERVMSCINQFLSSEEFISAIGNIIVAKTPYDPLEKATDRTVKKVVQGYNLFEIAMGNRKRKNAEITLSGTNLDDWLIWQATLIISKLIERIVKGDKDDGTR